MIIINFDTSKYKFDFDYKLLSKKLLKKVLEIEKIKYNISLNLSIVSLYRIRHFNKKFRNVDKTTDVLSFPNINLYKPSYFKNYVKNGYIDISIMDPNNKTIFLGDIVICYDKIISQSKKYNHSIKREFSFLFVHSTLHLLGYDHIFDRDEKVMFKKQEFILSSLNIIR